MFFLRDGANDPLYLEDSSGNFSKSKKDKFEGVDVTNSKFLEEASRRPLAMNLLEKRQSHQGTLCWNCGAWRLHVQKGIVSLAFLPSRRLCWQFVGNPENKKRGGYLYE